MPDEPHTIQAAMNRGELTEDEAYFILRFAGRLGYDRAIKRLQDPLKNFRRWFIWVGGWEHPELSQWDRGKPAWEAFYRGKLKSPTPVSLFNHRITIHYGDLPHSRWIDMQIAGGYLHVRLDGSKAYWSPNATPSHPEAIHFIK